MKMFKRILCFGLAMLLYVPMVNTGFAVAFVETVEVAGELQQIEAESVEVESFEEIKPIQVKRTLVEKKQSRAQQYAKIGAAIGAVFGGFCEGMGQYDFATSPQREKFYQDLKNEVKWSKRIGNKILARVGEGTLNVRAGTPKLVFNGVVSGTISGAMAGAGIGAVIGLICDEVC